MEKSSDIYIISPVGKIRVGSVVKVKIVCGLKSITTLRTVMAIDPIDNPSWPIEVLDSTKPQYIHKSNILEVKSY